MAEAGASSGAIPGEALAAELDARFAALDPSQRLALLRSSVSGRLVFTTSFGLEDQVLTHLAARSGLGVSFVTLDTGRLFNETYALWEETERRYGVAIRAFYPRHDAIEALIAAQGINGFYNSIEARKACCAARKVEPLGRALDGASVWITGLRADQSANRASARFAEFDAAHGVIKANLLLDWTRARAADFAAAENVPINPLHGKGFLSIGCAPCTRAVKPGEPERAGRWWWEDEAKKECGLHAAPDGRFVRASASSSDLELA